MHSSAEMLNKQSVVGLTFFHQSENDLVKVWAFRGIKDDEYHTRGCTQCLRAEVNSFGSMLACRASAM